MFDTPMCTVPVGTAADEEPADPVRWSERTPSAALVTVLARPPGPEMGSFERVERIGGFERTIAWLQALQAAEMAAFVQEAEDETAAELAGHDPAAGGRPGAWTVADAAQSATAEIQWMLHLTGATMFNRLHEARRLGEPALAPTAELARQGLLTWPKIRKILDGVTGLDPVHVERLQAKVLPTAPTRTTGQLGAAIDRFLAGLSDHQLPAKRRESRTRTRAVVVTPEPDGMAVLRAFLPAVAATGVYAVVDEHARGCGRADPRTMDQRRADALVDLVLRDTGLVATGSGAATGSASATAGPGATGAASDTAGPGATGAASDTAGPGATGAASDAAGPGATGPAVNPLGVPATPAGVAGGAVPGVTPAPAGGSPFVRNAVSVRINVTVSLDSLIGASDEPAELAGFGPIPASDARALAFDPGSVWYRLLTDPPTGRVVEYGTTRYRPPAVLSELVRARHGTCGAPGCRTPAHRCDLDHVVPYDPTAGTGPTCAGNLCPFFRPHHRLKHLPGWRVVLHADGTTVWATPSGHTHLAEPSPVGPVRATTGPTERGPGMREWLRDPDAYARLAERTAEPPF